MSFHLLSLGLMMSSVLAQRKPPDSTSPKANTTLRDPEARSPFTDFSECPSDYPPFETLGRLLETWSPNQPEVPENFIESLQVLNYSDPSQRAQAEHLRDCEVPFKVFGVPLADDAVKRWTDEYLQQKLYRCRGCVTMRSDTNRFMFWKQRSRVKDWAPPTVRHKMAYEVWRAWADEADNSKIGPDDEHFYFTNGVPATDKTPGPTGHFIADDIPFFSTRENNFFITDVEAQKGIQCRFGARGIIAESHFDTGKNFVLMLRGRKRYLLNPPRACPHLDIIKDREHPSFRHSTIDWADQSAWPEGFADAPGIDTVVEAGELLYIPSFWYHFIVSEGFSAQCNARSGVSKRKEWKRSTEQCLGLEFGRLKHRGGRSTREYRQRSRD